MNELKEIHEKAIRTIAIFGLIATILLFSIAIVEANTRNDVVNTARHAINKNADSSTKIKSGTAGNWNFLASTSGRYLELAKYYTSRDEKSVVTHCYASLWAIKGDICYDAIQNDISNNDWQLPSGTIPIR